MIPGKYSGLVTCIAAAGMGMFVAVWLLDFTLIRTEWCNGSEAVCFRDWLGALSGWIAAGGALVAAMLTLPYLKRQADDVKRQADFALGESTPTFDVYAEDFVEIHFRIVNWNRRTLLLDKITFEGIEHVIIKSVELSHRGSVPLYRFGITEDGTPEFNPAIRIAAFDDRSQPPVVCTIKAKSYGGIGVNKIAGIFTAHCRLLGETHGNIRLTASAAVNTFG